MSDNDNDDTERFADLAAKWRELAAKRDEAGNHVRAQTLRRCAGELERVIEAGSEQ